MLNKNDLRGIALDALSRREHSSLELKNKLRAACRKEKNAQGKCQQGKNTKDRNSENNNAKEKSAKNEDEAESANDTEALIESILLELQQQGLQSDARFCEAYINWRCNYFGNGPFKIKNALRERGIADSLIAATFSTLGIDWQLQARHAREKRFGTDLPTDFKTKAKQMRFLQARGFSNDHIKHSLCK